MRRFAYPIHHRIAHVDVAGRHVDLRAQHVGAVLELTRAHAAKQIEVFLDRTISKRAVAPGLGERAAIFAHLVGGQAVDVRLALAHELLGPLIELLEVIGRVIQVLAPVEAEPLDIALDLVDVLLRFLDGVGIVEPEIAPSAELVRDAEVDADRLGVADVQTAVRLGRKSRHDRAARFARHHVLGDDLSDEIARRGFRTALCAGTGHLRGQFSHMAELQANAWQKAQ
jgi:hypothetical protein